MKTSHTVGIPLWERVLARINPWHTCRCPCGGGQPPHDGPLCGDCACGGRV